MREEFKATVDAGIVLQPDDPCLAEGCDQVNPEPSVADYQKLAARWIEALNHAISGLPPDRIRLHLCWGSWHGPHVTDIPIRDIIEVVLKAKVGAISFEAGNVRHEHEWRRRAGGQSLQHTIPPAAAVAAPANAVLPPQLSVPPALRLLPHPLLGLPHV